MPKFKSSGQSYLDILITIGVFLILLHAIFTLVSASYQFINFTRARTAAKHLASEKIETVRNMAYSEIGTVGGIPAGSLLQTEAVKRNNLNYTVKTSVVYVDDPFDSSAPDDLLPTDYKRVRVDVSWEGLAASKANPVTLITDIAPQGVETTAGGGTLSILVFDSQAEPVPQATVKILAETVNPAVDLNLETADNGRVILPGATTCSDNCYQISVTKDGYSSDKTYSTEEVANPNKPHQNVLEGDLTEISFAIDKTSSLAVTSTQNKEADFASQPDVSFRLRGSKTLGADINDEPVYKFDQEFTTDSSGQLTIESLEWDNYDFFLPDGSSWDIAGTNPLTIPPGPIVVLPGQTLQLSFIAQAHTDHSLLAIFKDSSSILIASAAARLSASGFEASGSSGLSGDPDFGQLFFPSLTAQVYTLEATAAGFLDYNGSVDVNGTSVEEIIMETD